MNRDQIEGKLKQMKGSLKSRWGKLTDDDLDFVSGQKDQLVGRIQERYGIQKEEAQRQVEDWNRSQKVEHDEEDKDLDRKAS